MPALLEGRTGSTEEVIEIGCNCGGGTRTTTKFEVTFNDGSTRVYLSETEAKVEIQRRGGGTMRAVS